MKKYGLLVALLMESAIAVPEIPAVFTNSIKYQDGKMVMIDKTKGKTYPIRKEAPLYTLEAAEGKITGTDTGLAFDFGYFEGTLYYGLINYNDGNHPMPVFFKKSVPIENGKTKITIKGGLSGKYDMSGWEKAGKGTLGYRLVNTKGNIIYDGRVSFQGLGPFKTNVSFIEEPTVNYVTNDSAVIAFRTNFPSIAVVKLGDKTFNSSTSKNHEVKLTNLASDTIFYYTVTVSAPGQLSNSQSYSFSTAPKPGTRKPFVFAYASDSRAGQGGGERDIYGTNAYVMKKIMAVAKAKGAVFFQFTGDMINGRFNNVSETKLQYQNWKRAIEPFNHYMPVYSTMGNHEGLFHTFNDGSRIGINVARFPFATESAEAIFASQFVLPENGPVSEDGAEYDPNPQTPGDFPSYKENVYYYVYDNVAMVVLNSNYLFSQSFKYWFAKKHKKGTLASGGGLHGYLMDKQLEWLDKTLDKLEADPNIDFIFATQHTPIFPNGGHKVDDMWYDGNNSPRPYIAGKPVRHGVIEQRDRYLEMLLKHEKVVAVLTGDEHNYARMELTPETQIHLANWDNPKVEVTRSLWQINNGAAGAPYYAQETLPWSNQVKLFSTQNAVVFFHVDGQKLRIEVVNPETLERIE
ncbi:metallophosphoesterase [Candidatus Halobeggiatoa sp. HSG11]|nr:metallophosphoesterase [Candidatus Halobeggiatoa sp. HSG11]